MVNPTVWSSEGVGVGNQARAAELLEVRAVVRGVLPCEGADNESEARVPVASSDY